MDIYVANMTVAGMEGLKRYVQELITRVLFECKGLIPNFIETA